MDFIFLTGASAVGKSTLAKGLLERLKGVNIEQKGVPEFAIPPYVLDEGEYEEKVCFGDLLHQVEYFQKLGLKNLIVSDFDDLRTRELPVIFKGYRFIIIRLFSSDPEQIKVQMIHRAKTSGGLFAPEGVEKLNALIMSRPLLPNEVTLDIRGKTPEQVLADALSLIEDFTPLTNYDYTLADEKNYHSWVRSRGLNWEWTVK